MRTIGLIGGMSFESTAVYYRRINEAVRAARGGLHSAEVLLRSVDFARIVALQQAERWDEAAAVLAGIARELEAGGAGCIVICTNTMHKLAEPVARAVRVPLIHIADTTAAALKAAGRARPLLLATRYTMEQDFYRARLAQRHGLDALTPDEADRAAMHAIIFEELCRGVVREESRRAVVEMTARAAAAGADSVILGCTEIGMLVGQEDVALPVFDSTLLHADAAVAFSLGKSETQARSAA